MHPRQQGAWVCGTLMNHPRGQGTAPWDESDTLIPGSEPHSSRGQGINKLEQEMVIFLFYKRKVQYYGPCHYIVQGIP